MSVTVSPFGTHQNKEVLLFTLKNNNGMEVLLTNYGATVTSIKTPNKSGIIENIACGFDTLEGYFKPEYTENAPYFGGTIGRYCSQIKDAKFELNGKHFELAKNCGPNNLHGGALGFDKRLWEATPTANGVHMTLTSHDLEEGFPGNVAVSVLFTLTNDNELCIDYTATPDQDTPLSMTNHTYFNLDAFANTVENHQVTVHTTKRQVIDDTGAGTGEVMDIQGAADDLSRGKQIGDVHKAINDGFEHFYVFDNPDFTLQEVAHISADSGRSLRVFSTEPCMLLYTGKYTSDEITRENGEQYGKYKGFCCETHRYQNGPNIAGSPKSITKAGEQFQSKTIFKLGW